MGRGIWILAIALLGAVLFSWLVGRILLWSEEPAQGASAWYEPSRQKVFRLAALSCASLAAGALFVLYSRMLHNGSLAIGQLRRFTQYQADLLAKRECSDQVIDWVRYRHNLDFWPDQMVPSLVFVTGGILGGYLMYRGFVGRTRSTRPSRELDYRFRFRFFKEGVLRGWIYPGLIASYLVSVLSVLTLAFFLHVSLPFVYWVYVGPAASDELGTESGESIAGGTTSSGKNAGGLARFLSHSEGYWYAVSVPICTYQTPYYRSIIAIPDRNAADVQIVEE